MYILFRRLSTWKITCILQGTVNDPVFCTIRQNTGSFSVQVHTLSDKSSVKHFLPRPSYQETVPHRFFSISMCSSLFFYAALSFSSPVPTMSFSIILYKFRKFPACLRRVMQSCSNARITAEVLANSVKISSFSCMVTFFFPVAVFFTILAAIGIMHRYTGAILYPDNPRIIQTSPCCCEPSSVWKIL